jgi:hypothetical protein
MDEFDWVPDLVKPIFNRMAKHPLSPDRESVLHHLASDKRMKNVFGELLRRDRKTGDFLHPAQERSSSDPQSAEGSIGRNPTNPPTSSKRRWR